jgi:hypothetical protein
VNLGVAWTEENVRLEPLDFVVEDSLFTLPTAWKDLIALFNLPMRGFQGQDFKEPAAGSCLLIAAFDMLHWFPPSRCSR